MKLRQTLLMLGILAAYMASMILFVAAFAFMLTMK
jgi:hypothetical protein